VWLDRGELDKIIERSEVTPAPTQQVPPGFQNTYSRGDHHHDDHQYYDKHGRRRKKSFLGELFDFD
jgi:hypothetical protein